VKDKFAAKLGNLGFKLPHWCDPPSEELVVKFEQRFSVTLPTDYREFLCRHGGVTGTAVCSFQEPTPCGTETIIDGFYGFAPLERTDNIARATEFIGGAPSIVAIGDNLIGSMFWLMCDGNDTGYVYMHDHEGRSAWTDEMFHEWFPNLSPIIAQYLEIRKHGKLPRKPKGYEHLYRLARSFTDFIDALQSNTDYSCAENEYDQICKALLCCDEELLHELVAAGKLDEPMEYGWTPVELVAANLKPLQWLVNAGADLHGAMCSAAKGGAADAVRFLIDKGRPVEERSLGRTPLMAAVELPYPPERVHEFVEVARILIRRGADVNAISDDGKSVLRVAGGERYSNGRPHGPPEVVAFLEAAGAKLNPS
jgi:hypothetical protein